MEKSIPRWPLDGRHIQAHRDTAAANRPYTTAPHIQLTQISIIRHVRHFILYIICIYNVIRVRAGSFGNTAVHRTAGRAAKLDTRDGAVGQGSRPRRDKACARDFPVGRSGGQNTVKSLNGATAVYYNGPPSPRYTPIYIYIYRGIIYGTTRLWALWRRGAIGRIEFINLM